MPEGIEVGFDEVKLFDRVIADMEPSEEVPAAKIEQVRMCLQANVHNPATAYYHLLLKKKMMQGDPIEDTDDQETVTQ